MTEARYCTNCGGNLRIEAKFCGLCGTSAAGVSQEGSQTVYEETSGELPMVEFGPAIQRGLENFFNFRGRSTRAEYWWFSLFCGIVGIGLTIISLIPFIGWLIAIIGSIALWLPVISLSVRRLHDIGRSGWWLLVWQLPNVLWALWGISFVVAMIGLGERASDEMWSDEEGWTEFVSVLLAWIVAAIFLTVLSIGQFIWFLVWFLQKGDKGPNKHGLDPRQAIAQ